MHKVKRVLVMLMMVLAMIFVLAGCVAVRDSIPIMGENADGSQVIVSHATRTRLYALSKAAEKLDLWEVSSDDGVKMKGASSDSDGTAMVQALRDGIALGREVASGRSAGAGDAVIAYAPAAQSAPTSNRTIASGLIGEKISQAKASGMPLVVVAGSPDCSYCVQFESQLAASALPGSADIVFVREMSPWSSNSALAWTGGGDAPIVRITRWDSSGGLMSDKKMNRPTIAEVVAAIASCAP